MEKVTALTYITVNNVHSFQTFLPFFSSRDETNAERRDAVATL